MHWCMVLSFHGRFAKELRQTSQISGRAIDTCGPNFNLQSSWHHPLGGYRKLKEGGAQRPTALWGMLLLNMMVHDRYETCLSIYTVYVCVCAHRSWSFEKSVIFSPLFFVSRGALTQKQPPAVTTHKWFFQNMEMNAKQPVRCDGSDAAGGWGTEPPVGAGRGKRRVRAGVAGSSRTAAPYVEAFLRNFVSVRTHYSWERDGACIIDIHEELTRAPVPASAFGINYQKRN